MCSKPVAWKGAHCCGYGPYTCMLIKNPMMMMMMYSMAPDKNLDHFLGVFFENVSADCMIYNGLVIIVALKIPFLQSSFELLSMLFV